MAHLLIAMCQILLKMLIKRQTRRTAVNSPQTTKLHNPVQYTTPHRHCLQCILQNTTAVSATAVCMNYYLALQQALRQGQDCLHRLFPRY